MKLIYSYLQKFLPDLKVEPQKLRDDMTMIGHWTNFYEEIDNEIVFDLDIKVNRGDCLSYYGLAKDLSILYNLPLVSLVNFSLPKSNYSLPIKIETDNAYRVMACKIVHLQNKPSPEWLKTFLKLHDSKSINNLVDLTNYIMFMYGIPNHAFDTAKSTDQLVWQMNPKYSEFTSLDGTVLKLDKNILMVNNQNLALSLSFWGGEACAIDESTTNIIIEMAAYNPATVRQNSRQLKVNTEAATRLEKALDPESIPIAITHLIQLVIENCGGQVGSQLFDYYPNPIINQPIDFDPQSPSRVSGINIPSEFALDIVKKVGHRPDITIEEDLIEEVIRFYGYNKIPVNEPLSSETLPDITPPILYLIEKLKDDLVSQGYDEVITWPLVQTPTDPATAVKTQNSINSEYPYLRQSMTQSMQNQLDQYSRYKLRNPKFFEIGKIFSLVNGKYIEKYALGTYDGQKFTETILDDLPKPKSYIPKNINNSAIELTSQIITLDANVNFSSPQDPTALINHYTSLINPNILWSIEITDIFKNKYTFRVSYYNCDDKTAKSVHLTAFGLN